MLKTIALILVAAIAGLLLYAATRPDSFTITRSATIKAPPERIFALINDFRQFNAWNPWARKEPGAKLTYGKTEAGVGAHYGWVGEELGVGSMEITQVTAPTEVKAKLDFIKPFEAHNQVVFTITPEGDGQKVTWTMSGPSPYISKLMGVIFNMDKMVGKDFEDGLQNLKVMAETK